jgi:hypothetical protein
VVFAGAVAALETVFGDGFGVAMGVAVFAVGSAAGVGVIAPVVQICVRLSLFISNSMTLRFGSSGVAGGAMVLPFIASWIAVASERE